MKLQTGMPVEVFVATPPRSLLRYCATSAEPGVLDAERCAAT